MAKRRVWSEEEKHCLKDNLRYDPETGHLWWTKARPNLNMNKPVGYPSEEGYIKFEARFIKGKRTRYRAHRVVWFLCYGEEVDSLDHIDNDPSNNRIDNLRPATPQANQLNRKPWGKSGYKGVYKSGKKWQSRIKLNGINVYLGTFYTKEEAAEAFDKKCEEYKRRYPELAVYFTTNKDLGLL